MGRTGRHIGWCLLLASSLALCGCKSPRHEAPSPPLTELPNPGPPLQIPDMVPQNSTPGQSIVEPFDRPSLLPPLSDRLQPLPQWPPPDAPISAPSPLRKLHRLAVERFDTTPVYIARFRRRELFRDKERPPEEILFKYRKEPYSIYMRWLGKEAKDREVLYVKGLVNDMLYVVPAVNDPSGLKTNGRRPVLLPDTKPVLLPDTKNGLGNERYAIRETGVGALIDRFGGLLDAIESNRPGIGSVKHLGPVTRPEFEKPLEAVLQLLPPGADPMLPQGGQRLWYFDTSLRFPVLVIAHDERGQEVEYYCFDRFLFPAQISADDFSPAKLGQR